MKMSVLELVSVEDEGFVKTRTQWCHGEANPNEANLNSGA